MPGVKGRSGGPRPGAGLPKGYKMPKTLEREAMEKAARDVYYQTIFPKLQEIAEAQIDAAKGYALIDRSDDTGERIYDKGPSVDAQKYIFDRFMGKVTERVDHTSGGQPLQIGWMKPDETD